jgi:hypothetical protein
MRRFGRGALALPMAHPMDSGLWVKVDSKEDPARSTPRMNGDAIWSCTSPMQVNFLNAAWLALHTMFQSAYLKERIGDPVFKPFSAVNVIYTKRGRRKNVIYARGPEKTASFLVPCGEAISGQNGVRGGE